MATTRMGRWIGAAALCAALAVLAACGGGGSEPPPPPPSEGSATVDDAGGTVNGPDGVALVIPPDALTTRTTFRIARDGSGAPEMGGLKLISPVYAITPHGTEFGASARVSIPFDASQLAPGTQPVLVKAQPGGGWTALVSDTIGSSVSAADTPSLSYYAVGTCYTTRDNGVSGPDPLLYCPTSHRLQLTLRDGNGAVVETPRSATGYALPAMTITAPTTLNLNMTWTRPAGTNRSDSVGLWLVNAGLQLAQQPLTNFATNNNSFSYDRAVAIDPASVPGAGASGGVIVRIKAWASYTVDAFYPGCVCFRPASWTFETEIPVRVVFAGTQPRITQQPANQSVSEGQSATFSVVATGSNLSYQWSRYTGQTETVIAPSEGSGARSASHTTPATTFAQNNRLYAVRVCSNAGTAMEQCINSNAALLTVAQRLVAPSFTAPPQPITVTEGETITLQAVASGEPAPTIGWSKLNTLGPFTSYDPVCTPTTGSGTSTGASCALGAMTLADSASRYIASASNAAGSVNSATVTVTVLPRPVAPTITSAGALSDRSIMAGGSVSWTVTASGTAPINYAWYSTPAGGSRVGGIVCTGGASPGQSVNGNTLALSNVPQACDGLRVEVVVSNGQGAANPAARIATLSVTAAPAAPQITVPLANRSVLDGTQVTFNVAATGTPATFSYAWTLAGAAIPGCGSTSASCTFTALLEDNGKTVAVSVANGVAPAAQSSATLTVTTNDMPATISAQPVSQGVVAGNTATFTVGAAGTPTPTVQWQSSSDGGTTWSNAGGGNSLILTNTTLAQNGLLVRAQASNTTRIVGGTQTNTVMSNVASLAVIANVPADALLATQVITLGGRTLALHPDGNVYAWGNYVDPVTGGYTPNGTRAYRPLRVWGLGATRQVAIGSDYSSWALGQDGTVWGWGSFNSYEAFGQGPGNGALQFFSPVRVLTAANTPIDRVCQIEGSIYGVVMVRSEVVGGTCAASEPRSVWYTANITGNEATSVRYAQRYTRLDSGGVLLPAGRWITQVVSSRNYGVSVNSVFALANDGTVYAWGYNTQGQLGLGVTGTATTPQLAAGWAGAVRMAASGEVTLAVMSDGSVRGAGWNPSASLGIGAVSYDIVSTPTPLPGITGASDVSTAFGASMALVGGELRYWGNNPRYASGTQETPIALSAPATPLTSLSVGTAVSVAIGPGNVVYAWGDATFRGCTPNGTDCNATTTVPAMVTLPPPQAPALSVFAGDFSAGGAGGGSSGTAARFDFPEGLIADAAGNTLYVPSSNGGRVSKVDGGATVTTIAQHPGTTHLALAPNGDLYSAAVSYCGLMRIAAPLDASAASQAITLTGCPGSETRGAAIDANGVLYLTLRDANSIMRVGPVSGGAATATLVAGAASTYAPPGSNDGAGINARFNAPRGIAFGPDGYLYVADSGNHTIRRIASDGTVSTYAGATGVAGTVNGNAADARFDNPTDLSFDAGGNLLVLQRGPDASPQAYVRRITPAGVVSTLFDATAESVALAAPGQEPFARAIRGMTAMGSNRVALSAGNAILVRTLP